MDVRRPAQPFVVTRLSVHSPECSGVSLQVMIMNRSSSVPIAFCCSVQVSSDAQKKSHNIIASGLAGTPSFVFLEDRCHRGTERCAIQCFHPSSGFRGRTRKCRPTNEVEQPHHEPYKICNFSRLPTFCPFPSLQSQHSANAKLEKAEGGMPSRTAAQANTMRVS